MTVGGGVTATTTTPVRLYLASTSPARLATLRAAGIEPVTLPSHVDEPATTAAEEERLGRRLSTAEMVQLLARAKAEAVVGRLVDDEPIDGFILGGDSAFELDGEIYGKPHEPEVARERWLLQRGRTGELFSGHWLIDHRGGRAGRAAGAVASALVTFADDIGDDEIDAYVATGEPLKVAGAFTIDSLGGAFITRVEGDPSTVVGLSLSTLRSLFRDAGVPWHRLWQPAL
ncbi:Maf family protein [Microbacterium sp. STN6]|uniref:Maf family protein n=1 Tax=Microbacterium sp. STN6 TaxID=2995588 RepID=UPI002260D01F|nr:nucleoside triphosphate pyrophosphatase [Microbacterium sp. STN6]MCX7520985.1 Maf family protein [Microbacterium sp. STN6]